MNTKDKYNTILYNNYTQFVLSCDRLRKIETLELKTIQRVVSPYCKTSFLGNTLYLKIKGYPLGLSISLLPKNSLYPSPYYRLKVSEKLFIDVSAVNLNELMYKVNHIYKLTFPTFLDYDQKKFPKQA